MGYTYDYSVYVDYTLCMYLHVLDELDTILPKVNWVSLHMQSIHSLGIDHIWTCDIIKLRQEWYLLSERLFIYTFHIRVFPDVRQTLFGPFKYVWDILCLPFFWAQNLNNSRMLVHLVPLVVFFRLIQVQHITQYLLATL